MKNEKLPFGRGLVFRPGAENGEEGLKLFLAGVAENAGVGMHLLNRLSRAYGPAVGEDHAFPRPVDLASASPAQLRRLGFSGNKSLVILAAARAVAGGRLNLEDLAGVDTAEALDRLIALRGIGRWTAQYILLRGLGRLDVFPADDVGSQNKMQRWLRRRQRPDYDQMYRILAPWRPYRGLLYFYLLLNHQAREGLLKPIPTSSRHTTDLGNAGTRQPR